MVRKRSVSQQRKRRLNVAGLATRFLLCPTQPISSAEISQWAKTRGSYHVEEDEPVEQKVQDASMCRLRKVVPTSEWTGDAHE